MNCNSVNWQKSLVGLSQIESETESAKNSDAVFNKSEDICVAYHENKAESNNKTATVVNTKEKYNEIANDNCAEKTIPNMNEQENIIKTLCTQNENLKQENKKLEASIRDLNDENQFLADTIIKHNMGNIIKERQTLLAEIDDIKKQTAIVLQEAENKKKQYEDMSAQIQDLIDDINYKQADINNYVQNRSQLIINDLKAELLQTNAKELAEQKQKNDLYIQKIGTKMKTKIKILWMSLVFSFIVSVIAIMRIFL